MRKVLHLLIFLLSLACLLHAQPSRTSNLLKHAQWKLVFEGSDTINIDFHSLQHLPDTLKAGMVLTTLLECDQDAATGSLYFPGAAAFFDFYVNQEPLNNELYDENYHAETGPIAAKDEYQLSLKIREDIAPDAFMNLFEYASFSLLNQVFICHFRTLEDAFFGGSLLEATLQNVWNYDVDGKLVASVYDLKTREVLTENNNCAFVRQGSESVVEVNFPDAEKLIKGKVYLFNLILLDKENNEEIVDELTIPLRY